MLDALLTAGISPPRFEDRIWSFVVTFPNHTLLSEETLRWITGLGEQGLTDSQCVALAILREEEALDNRAYRTATGVDSRVATAELEPSSPANSSPRPGTRRWAQYRLSPRTSLPRRGRGIAGRSPSGAACCPRRRHALTSRTSCTDGAETSRRSGAG